MPPVVRPMRLQIEPVVATAEAVAKRVQTDLPGHDGLAGAAQSVAGAALQAQSVSRRLKRPWSLHRLPAWFLALALCLLLGWIYWRFFHISQLTIAIPDRDAVELREKIGRHETVRFTLQTVPGSRESVALVAAGRVDVAFVQGGMEIPRGLPRLESPSSELVLWMTRKDRIHQLDQVRTILTSLPGEGSQTVASQFLQAWNIDPRQIQWVHDWRVLTANQDYSIPETVDAVFVVKDPAEEKTLDAVARLSEAGFELASPALGARVTQLPYLAPFEIPPGWIRISPPIPERAIASYQVKTYLVARQGLTPRLLAESSRLLDAAPVDSFHSGAQPSVAEASDIFQGIEAFLGILVNIGLAFLALLGLEMLTYHKRFHELNSLVSLLSMLQSNKDVLGLADPVRRAENLLYLSLCSDLLGLISMISGYYTQENAGLLSNSLSEIVHQRCDGLKINIQLKILHAGVTIPEYRLPAPESAAAPATEPPRPAVSE